MSLTWPLALLGLLGIPLLILLERRRRRPRARVWPSLQLWRVVENMDAPSKRKIQPLLIYECAAVLLLALAAAGPVAKGGEEPEIIVLVDSGPHMSAPRGNGTALDATLAEVERIPGRKRFVDVSGDLVFAATSFDEPVILATNRPGVEGKGYIVVGRASDVHNVGIDAVHVKGDRLWFAIATDGPPREVALVVGQRRMTAHTGILVELTFRKSAQPGLADEVIRIVDDVSYEHDNTCVLRRLSVVVRHDSESAFLKSALRVGVPLAADQGAADLEIRTTGGDAIAGPVRGADCVIHTTLFDNVLLDGCVWTGARGKRIERGPDQPNVLLSHNGLALVTADRSGEHPTLWFGLPMDRDWDEHGTLAVVIDRLKRASITRVGEKIVGDAIANPAPGFVDTRGVDRPWDGTIPKGRKTTTEEANLSWILAVLAVAVLALYARAILRA